MSTLRKGFTLIELLLVIGIIAILASIVIVAINPTRQLGNTRDAQRRADVNTILSAVYQYAIDNNGAIPASIAEGTGSTAYICVGSDCEGFTDLPELTTSGRYLVGLPRDPQASLTTTCPGGASGTGTCYKIYKDGNSRVTVTAPHKEISTTDISVTR